MSHFTFHIEPFEPQIRNPHWQTILGALYRRTNGVTLERVRVELPDGDFIDLDFPRIPGVSLPQNAPLVLLLHGLEGNAYSGYACETYTLMAQWGFRSVGMNFRSCSGVMNRLARMYHLGATDDVAFIHAWLEKQFPGVRLLMIGFSLGANMLLKYLGENSAALTGRVQAAVAVSPPFRLNYDKAALDMGFNRFYRERLMRQLRAKARQKAALINAAGGDAYRAITGITLEDFDNAVTAPLNGFLDAKDYYRKNASGQFLPVIRVPTLIVRALDDPFFHPDIPYDSIQANPYLYQGIVQHGGHVGFMEGTTPFNKQDWAQRQAARFFKMAINQSL
jgi:hypothetical protein